MEPLKYAVFLAQHKLIDAIQFWLNTLDDLYIDKTEVYKFVEKLRPSL